MARMFVEVLGLAGKVTALVTFLKALTGVLDVVASVIAALVANKFIRWLEGVSVIGAESESVIVIPEVILSIPVLGDLLVAVLPYLTRLNVWSVVMVIALSNLENIYDVVVGLQNQINLVLEFAEYLEVEK